MMQKKYKIWIILDVVLLLVLYMASFADDFFYEQATKIWNVSVIMDMAEDGTEKNFLSGLEKAAREYKMDMRYLNIRKYKSNPKKFMELIEKEALTGCDALILGCNEKEAEKILGMLSVGTPVILIDTVIEFPMVKAWFREDEKNMAQQITNILMEKERDKKEVLIVSHSKSSDQVRRIHDILSWKLQRAGIDHTEIEVNNKKEWLAYTEKLGRHQDYAVVSVDTLILEMIIKQSFQEEDRFSLYGVGWSSEIRRGLEEGVVSAVVVPHTFETGYATMHKVYQIMKKQSMKDEQIAISTIVVTKDNLYGDKKTEAVLFPFL